ncbi:VOC family protein [Candidatus Dojkabacteria bacterium]|nr:VOC family protein [Candidatus Dojkabacteria bacterium]
MILSDYKNFLDKLFSELNSLEIDVSDFKLDHIAYKVASDEEYDDLKPQFMKIGKEVREVIVGGRRVGVFKLHKELPYKQYRISAVELIAPEKGERVVSGFEHAEFVIDESFKSFMDRYPDLAWNTSALSRDKYQMLKLKLDGGMQVKFPRKSILVS